MTPSFARPVTAAGVRVHLGWPRSATPGYSSPPELPRTSRLLLRSSFNHSPAYRMRHWPACPGTFSEKPLVAPWRPEERSRRRLPAMAGLPRTKIDMHAPKDVHAGLRIMLWRLRRLGFLEGKLQTRHLDPLSSSYYAQRLTCSEHKEIAFLPLNRCPREI